MLGAKLQKSVSVHNRHRKVKQNETWEMRRVLQYVDSLLAVLRLQNRIAPQVEQPSQGLSHGSVVVHPSTTSTSFSLIGLPFHMHLLQSSLSGCIYRAAPKIDLSRSFVV